MLLLLLLVHGVCSQMEYSSQIKLGVQLESGQDGLRTTRAAQKGFKIHVSEDSSIAALGIEKARSVQAAVKEVVSYWSERLEVRRPVNRILLDRQCAGPGIWTGVGCPADNGCKAVTMCGEVRVPENHLSRCKLCGSKGCTDTGPEGRGVSGVDMIIYVSSRQSNLCQESATLSHASHCQQEATLDRPVAGHVNICPNNLDFTTVDGQVNLVDNIKHELLHALGFSVQLYAFFRDGRGKPRTPRGRTGKPPLHSKYYLYVASDKTVKRVERANWQVAGGNVTKRVHMLVTPRVRREVRRHFKCNSIEGGELEDQGDLGTSMTHWEKRVFGDEAMTGNQQELNLGGRKWRELARISRITLAVLQDSGWYKVNFRKADPYTWGKNAGCTFVKKSCLQFMRERNRTPRRSGGNAIAPYCDKKSPLSVSRRKRQANGCRKEISTLFCNLIKYGKPLRREHQNLDFLEDTDTDLDRWGAGMWLADFCPTTLRMYSIDCGGSEE